MSEEIFDLNLTYRTALAGIHRAYVFMQFGVQGVSVSDFEQTALRGRRPELLIVPEPIASDVLQDYLTQFRSWVVGNGLRELVETYCQFLDEVYVRGLEVLTTPDLDRRRRVFEQASLRDKIRRLRDEMDIEGVFGRHFENFSAARNALTHGVGTVRQRDCTDGDELVLILGGIDLYFVGDDGVRYRVGDEPNGMRVREPLETVNVNREKRWKVGQKVILSAYELAEICFMANHDAIDILDALCGFGLRHGVIMRPAKKIRGGEQDDGS